LPGTVWAPLTHRSTLTGTKDTGKLAVGACDGQPTQAGSPPTTGPPLTVGTGVADPDDTVGAADPEGAADPPDPDGAADAVVADAVGVTPPDGEPACDVPHPASATAASSAEAMAHARGPAGRAGVIGAFGVVMAVPRFSGHPLDGARVAGGFTRSPSFTAHRSARAGNAREAATVNGTLRGFSFPPVPAML
jgi:hypothetical protein